MAQSRKDLEHAHLACRQLLEHVHMWQDQVLVFFEPGPAPAANETPPPDFGTVPGFQLADIVDGLMRLRQRLVSCALNFQTVADAFADAYPGIAEFGHIHAQSFHELSIRAVEELIRSAFGAPPVLRAMHDVVGEDGDKHVAVAKELESDKGSWPLNTDILIRALVRERLAWGQHIQPNLIDVGRHVEALMKEWRALERATLATQKELPLGLDTEPAQERAHEHSIVLIAEPPTVLIDNRPFLHGGYQLTNLYALIAAADRRSVKMTSDQMKDLKQSLKKDGFAWLAEAMPRRIDKRYLFLRPTTVIVKQMKYPE
jgi:hypothetical protein